MSESSVSVPYSNPSVMKSTASVGSYDPAVSDAELPLTANFRAASGPGFQQWDDSGRAVGYNPDPMLHAPQPQRPAAASRIPLGASNAPTPGASEQGSGRPSPVRQDTASSWDARPHVGGAEAIRLVGRDRKSTRLNSSHSGEPRMPSSA